MDFTLKYEEKTVFSLRSLYSKYGYSQYKMNKFEEYDLYVKNKDFLISDSVITFTDTNGKLMALKPDVTLSMVKGSRDTAGYVEKLYYNENVYRVSKGTKSFKEIMQVGLECIGDVDAYCKSEVIELAAKSLRMISESSVLTVSHLGVLSALLDFCEVTDSFKSDITKCIEGKNGHELKALCKENGISGENTELLAELVSAYGSPDAVIPKLSALCNSPAYKSALSEFESILKLVSDDVKPTLQIDFSVVSNTKYYNGIVFKGFVEKVPNSVLSGGQYDALMKRMSKKSGAIGFAVYLDMLDSLKCSTEEYEEDTVVLYDETTDIVELKALCEKLIKEGARVSAQRTLPSKLTYKRLIKFTNGEVKTIENNA